MDEHLLKRHEAWRISKAKEDDTAQIICLESQRKANVRRMSIDNVNWETHLNAQQGAFARRTSGKDDAAREAYLSIRHIRDRKSRAAENVTWEAHSTMRYEAHARRRSNRHPKDLQPHYLGHMDKVCTYCGALHWSDEGLSISFESNPQFGSCCLKGKVYLSLTPKGLRGVFSKKHSKAAVSSSRSPTDFFSIFFHF
jgi:5-methylcytosine-specific restriction endonuclease McrA